MVATSNATLRACVAVLVTLLTAETASGFSGNALAARHYDVGKRALLAGDAAGAMDALVRATDLDYGLSVAHYELGMLNAAGSRWREAEARFQAATGPEPPNACFADAYFRLGEVQLKGIADAASAVEALERCVAIEPGHSSARRLLGIAYGRVGRRDEAVVALRLAVAANPDDNEARHELGSALLRVRAYEEAAEQLRALVDRDPLRAEAWLSLGNALIRAGQAERGREMLATHHRLVEQVEEIARLGRELEATPRDPESWYRLGRVRMERREWGDAALALDRCAALAPDDPRGYEALGYVYGRLDAYEQALAVYAELMRRRPGVAAYHNGLGVLLLRMRDVESAISQFSDAIGIDATEPGYYLNLAAAHRQAGDEKRAGEAYATYQRLTGELK